LVVDNFSCEDFVAVMVEAIFVVFAVVIDSCSFVTDTLQSVLSG
jgi:hypothetical protein